MFGYESPQLSSDYITGERQFASPVRTGFDIETGCTYARSKSHNQFLVQPDLEFCRAIELNLSQRP